MKEKEFNLSEKINEVIRSDGLHNLTDIEEIEQHFKQFIKEILDEIDGWVYGDNPPHFSINEDNIEEFKKQIKQKAGLK